MNRFSLGRLIIAAALAASTATAQSPRTAFDAVSIKRNRTGAAASDTNTTPGRLSLVNVTMMSVMLRAFRVQAAQIVGGPDWLLNERYDIVAVTGDGTALTDEARQMYLQALLADRCQLTFHRDIREIRVYSLVPSKNGAKLASGTGADAYSMRIQPAEDGRLRLRSTKGNMPRFAEILTAQVGDLVTDRTGLSGEYDFTLEWVPDVNATGAGPSLFTALDEQLGLKLESARTAVQAVAIDRIERPTEN